MSAVIEKVYGLAQKNGIEPQDELISINTHPIRDFLDLSYFGADETLTIVLKRKAKTLTLEFKRNWDIPLGIELAPHKCRNCANNCIFCFVEQMAPKLRQSLYVKDDDPLFSFLYGNYITLTNFSETDYARIVEQKISPLYISVHTTNPLLRQKMMGYKKKFSILEKLSFLAKNGIELHAQIVIVPGYNDEKELISSLTDLCKLNLRSIGIVPVGLTKFRDNLPALRPITKKEALQVLETVAQFGKKHIFCSDEFYLLASLPLPDTRFYRGFPQLENGIGMLRKMLNGFKRKKAIFQKKFKDSRLLFVTGTSALPILQQLADELRQEAHMHVQVQAVQNDFFGRSVTVTGLLTAEDIFGQIKRQADILPVFCDSIFNADGLTLDNKNKEDFQAFYGKCLFVEEFFNAWEPYGEL